jgi:threonine aldolase
MAMHRMLDLVDDSTRPEDPIAELERRIAELLGTEAALFFASGTMGRRWKRELLSGVAGTPLR